MVKRKVILCSESRGLIQSPIKPPEKYSIDGEAIIGLLKNNIAALKAESFEIEAIGFNGKAAFMEKVPTFVKNKFAEFRHRSHEVEIFIIALRDSDTSDGKKIAGFRQKLTNKIRKLIGEQEFKRVYIMFAVQAIEAWILADEQKLNEYLKVTNKAKHLNEPEKVDDPKQAGQNFFQQYGRKYAPQELLNLLPQLRVSELLRCKHFKEFYACVQKIVEASA
jgi:hypothetical protein